MPPRHILEVEEKKIMRGKVIINHQMGSTEPKICSAIVCSDSLRQLQITCFYGIAQCAFHIRKNALHSTLKIFNPNCC